MATASKSELIILRELAHETGLTADELRDAAYRMAEHATKMQKAVGDTSGIFKEFLHDYLETMKTDKEAFLIFLKDFKADLVKGVVSPENRPGKDVLKIMGIDSKEMYANYKFQQILMRDIAKSEREMVKAMNADLKDRVSARTALKQRDQLEKQLLVALKNGLIPKQTLDSLKSLPGYGGSRGHVLPATKSAFEKVFGKKDDSVEGTPSAQDVKEYNEHVIKILEELKTNAKTETKGEKLLKLIKSDKDTAEAKFVKLIGTGIMKLGSVGLSMWKNRDKNVGGGTIAPVAKSPLAPVKVTGDSTEMIANMLGYKLNRNMGKTGSRWTGEGGSFVKGSEVEAKVLATVNKLLVVSQKEETTLDDILETLKKGDATLEDYLNKSDDNTAKITEDDKTEEKKDSGKGWLLPALIAIGSGIKSLFGGLMNLGTRIISGIVSGLGKLLPSLVSGFTNILSKVLPVLASPLGLAAATVGSVGAAAYLFNKGNTEYGERMAGEKTAYNADDAKLRANYIKEGKLTQYHRDKGIVDVDGKKVRKFVDSRTGEEVMIDAAGKTLPSAVKSQKTSTEDALNDEIDKLKTENGKASSEKPVNVVVAPNTQNNVSTSGGSVRFSVRNPDSTIQRILHDLTPSYVAN